MLVVSFVFLQAILSCVLMLFVTNPFYLGFFESGFAAKIRVLLKLIIVIRFKLMIKKLLT